MQDSLKTDEVLTVLCTCLACRCRFEVRSYAFPWWGTDCPAPPIRSKRLVMSAASILSEPAQMIRVNDSLTGWYSSQCLQRHIDRLQHFLNDILCCDAFEDCFDGFERAAPLHASLILRRSNDDAMWIDLARCKRNQRW
jgi:hypothetical protein